MTYSSSLMLFIQLCFTFFIHLESTATTTTPWTELMGIDYFLDFDRANFSKRQSTLFIQTNQIYLPKQYSKTEAQPFIACPLLTDADTYSSSTLPLVKDPIFGVIMFIPEGMTSAAIEVTSRGNSHRCQYDVKRGKEEKVRFEVEFLTKSGGYGQATQPSEVKIGSTHIQFGAFDNNFPIRFAVVSYVNFKSVSKNLSSIDITYNGPGSWETHMIIVRMFFRYKANRYYSKGGQSYSFAPGIVKTIDVNEMTNEYFRPYFDQWQLKINLKGQDQLRSVVIIRLFDEFNNYLEKDFDANEYTGLQSTYWEIDSMMEQMMGNVRRVEICIMNQGETRSLGVSTIEIGSPYAKYTSSVNTDLQQNTCTSFQTEYLESLLIN